jgi:hypothetical protein
VHRKLSPADRAEIVARVGSETYAQLAAAFGVHSSRVGQIVAEARAAEDIETAALRERHRLALELVPGLAPEERFDLLVAVVAPSPALAAASRNAARPQLDREPRLCRRGVSVAVPAAASATPIRRPSAAVRVAWREAARRRRKRAREDAL